MKDPSMKYAALDKLNDLKMKGIISDEEYSYEKEKLLNSEEVDYNQRSDENAYWGTNEKTFAMALHLSQFASLVVPLLGLILPIVMWASFKDKNEFINQNGRNAINWIISSTIYLIISIVLVFFIIGIPMLILLLVLDIVFIIMAAVKASNGINWQYPMSIRFL